MTTESKGGSDPNWHFVWEDWNNCVDEPLEDRERYLVNLLTTLGKEFRPLTPRPFWDHEAFTYDPKNPEKSANFHYCLVDNSRFIFCGDEKDCKCSNDKFYSNLRKAPCLTPRMLQVREPVSDKEALLQQKAVNHLAKQLRDTCDKIFDRSIPFVVDAAILKRLCDAIERVGSNREEDNPEYQEFKDLVMFILDFCHQTPSLCIGVPKVKTKSESGGDFDSSTTDRESVRGAGPSPRGRKGPPSVSSGESYSKSDTVDVSIFKSLENLELRNMHPNRLSGLNSVRMHVKKIKCSRNLRSIGQVLRVSGNASITQVWPDLKELDLGYNIISGVSQEEIAVLELCPSLQVLNLSRNKIVAVDDLFSRVLNSLSYLNLSHNRLTSIPPVPPNLKTFVLSHNLITNLHAPKGLVTHVDPFNLVCPLKNVEVLDLSHNLISKESDLVPLKDMVRLRQLNLNGNPVSFSEGYRKNLGGYLNRCVISRRFELDGKHLSASEVRAAIKECQEEKFIPYVPASSLLISQANSAMSTSQSSGASMSTSSMQRSGTSLSPFQNMSKSYDSTSSSMRSLRRKKPKIREILNLDFTEDRENSYSEGTASSVKSGSSLESSKKKSETQLKNEPEVTKEVLKALRDRYGPEIWLLRQAGPEVDRLLRIPDQPMSYEILSRSLPYSEREFGESSFNSTRSPPTSSLYYERAMENDKYTNEELLLIKGKKKQSKASSSENASKENANNTPKVDEEEEPDFFSCFSADSGNPQEDVSIFDMSKDEPLEEIFSEKGKTFESFRIFQNGEVFKLVIYDDYLIEINPDGNVVLNKWDLNSLFALEEEKCDSDTESVQFLLKFDTMKKMMRQRSFIMSAKDFHEFDKEVARFIEERTLQEFAEPLQCAKCFAQFSRAMALKTVKHEKGEAPREVKICPNPECGHDVLLTLDNIPLPNNECLDWDLDEGRLRRSPLKASTPVSARLAQNKSLSQSIPSNKGRSPRVFDFMRLLPSSLTARKSGINDEDEINRHNYSDGRNIPTVTVYAAKEATPTSSDGGTTINTKSESDIEVLSTDSSSIEVLGKHCPDSGSEIDVEEGVEIPLIDPAIAHQLGAKTVVMSESTSSSSCADSIVTTYEKHLLPISQTLSNASRMPSGSSASLCTNASLASTSTLTGNSFNNSLSNTCMPVRYDYVNFKRTDHRLQLWADVALFKGDEHLLALTKCLIISKSSSPGNFLGIIIFSSKKTYLYKIIGDEGDRPQEWLQKVAVYDLSKFSKLDVLIGRHGVGVDFSGKYYSLVFRDSERTSGFLEFFMSDICGELTSPPMVRDFSQTQKMMLSPQNPISYFGILRFSVCDRADHAYSVSAILLTNEEILLISDLGWLAGRSDKVTSTHGRKLANLRQAELLESDFTFIRLMFELEPDKLTTWDLIFETEGERARFLESLKTVLDPSFPVVCLSQPLEST